MSSIINNAAKSFDLTTLNTFLQAKKWEGAKEYINTYFFKLKATNGSPSMVAFWCPRTCRICYLKYPEVKSENFLHKSLNCKLFKPQDWFLSGIENPIYYGIENAIDEPRIFERYGDKFLNVYEPSPYAEFEQDYDTSAFKKKLALLWHHIEVVWSSGYKEAFLFNKQLIINIVSGHKVPIITLIESLQGIGKSIITDFISACIGVWNSAIITNINDIVGNFNSSWADKQLLIAEEMPHSASSGRDNLYESLKDPSTGKRIMLKTKHESNRMIENHLSIFVFSNHAAIRGSLAMRRVNCCTPDARYKGNKEYFTKLGNALESKTFQQQFYNYCEDNYDPKFKYQDPPNTTSLQEMKRNKLPLPIKFIKEKYLLDENAEFNGMGIVDFRRQLTEYVVHDLGLNKQMAGKTEKVAKTITDLTGGLISIKRHANKGIIRCDKQELTEFFKKNDWFGSLDFIPQVLEIKTDLTEFE